jgi:MSHA biogenesis protein MshM
MYLNHFGLTDSPFKITPHTEVFFEGAQRGAILDALVYAVVQGEGLMKVTGEVGTGKTMLCRMLAERLPESVETIYLAIPSLTRDEMLGAIVEDLGLDAQAQNGAQLLRALQSKLIELHESSRRVVVLIDEAHAMPLESLEEIRLLSNLETNSSKLLQIVLFGQPELDTHLALKHMRQLKERITQSFKLEPLSEQEVNQYLNFRLRAAGYRGPELFNARCTKMMTRASQGLSRRINIIADKSMLAAFAANTHDIEPNHVKAAIRDSEFQSPRQRNTLWISASFALLGAVTGGILTWVLTRGSPHSAAASSPLASAQTAQPGAGTGASNAPVKLAAVQTTQGAVAADVARVEAVDDGGSKTQIGKTATVKTTTAEIEKAAVVGNTAAKVEASQQWMQGQRGEHWVIQLMLSDFGEQSERAAFIARASAMLGEDKLHQYPLQLSGTKKIGVLYGPFPDRREAQRALIALPSSLKQYQPYMRTVGVVRQEATYH